MSKFSSYSCVAWLKTSVGTLLMSMALMTWAEERAPQLIDSPYQAVEASVVEFLINSSGEVVGIRVEGCPECSSLTILPMRNLVVEAAKGHQLRGEEILRVSGRPGVIHIYQPTGLAHRVSFPTVSSFGGDEQ